MLAICSAERMSNDVFIVGSGKCVLLYKEVICLNCKFRLICWTDDETVLNVAYFLLPEKQGVDERLSLQLQTKKR